jgi:hypothetical protein
MQRIADPGATEIGKAIPTWRWNLNHRVLANL